MNQSDQIFEVKNDFRAKYLILGAYTQVPGLLQTLSLEDQKKFLQAIIVELKQRSTLADLQKVHQGKFLISLQLSENEPSIEVSPYMFQISSSKHRFLKSFEITFNEELIKLYPINKTIKGGNPESSFQKTFGLIEQFTITGDQVLEGACKLITFTFLNIIIDQPNRTDEHDDQTETSELDRAFISEVMIESPIQNEGRSNYHFHIVSLKYHR